MNKKRPAILGVSIIALIAGAYIVTNMFSNKESNGLQSNRDWVGISLHALSADEAKLVEDTGARWIRIDASNDFGTAVANAKAHSLKVLGILDSWDVQ